VPNVIAKRSKDKDKDKIILDKRLWKLFESHTTASLYKKSHL
jgi:hypothetical protein